MKLSYRQKVLLCVLHEHTDRESGRYYTGPPPAYGCVRSEIVNDNVYFDLDSDKRTLKSLVARGLARAHGADPRRPYGYSATEDGSLEAERLRESGEVTKP